MGQRKRRMMGGHEKDALDTSPPKDQCLHVFWKWVKYAKKRLFMVVTGHYLKYLELAYVPGTGIHILGFRRKDTGELCGIAGWEYSQNNNAQITLMKHLELENGFPKFFWIKTIDTIMRQRHNPGPSLVFCGTTADELKTRIGLDSWKSYKLVLRGGGKLSMILRTTPVEKVDLPPGGNVWVKREDLCTQPPAPPFSKMRGVLAHLKECKGRGAKYIGYTETSISMAGWGVAYACKELGGLRAIIYDPQYKNPLPILQLHRKMWGELGAETRPIKAGMAKVNWHISHKMLVEEFGPERALLLPLGLPLPETIALTAEETERTLQDFPETRSIVVNIGSGTIGAGVWKGAEKWTENNAPPQKVTIYGVMGRTGHIGQKTAKIAQKAGLQHEGIFQTRTKFILEDPGWEYTERSNAICPFPCHPYYDLKAWEWLVSNYEKLEKPVIFWNIGH